MNSKVEWIAVDWGTSNLRAWGMDASGTPVFERESPQGMGTLLPADYPSVLTELLDGALPDPEYSYDVVICGMAGARQGWCEAPYIETPATLVDLGKRAVTPPMPNSALKPRILSGVSQNKPGREDVMRGEETQLLGLLALQPGFTGTVLMPGTHSKWVRIENGAVIEFATAMTGELFEILRTHSVLRHSMPEDQIGEDIEAGVSAGLDAGIAEPEVLSGNLFRTRAAALLSDKSSHWCAGYLSGLLVGAEVAGHKSWHTKAPIPLIGSARLCRLYSNAIERMGSDTETVDAGAAVLAGLGTAREHLS